MEVGARDLADPRRQPVGTSSGGALGLSAVAGWLRQKSNNDAACGDGGCSSCGSCGSADSANVTANVNGSGDAAPQVIKLHFRQTPRA
ncbi:hypothetical protein ACFS07_05435 [Undibacterium arcticum]